MIRPIALFTGALLVAAATALTSTAQERVAKKEAKDFPALMASATAAWNEGKFGAAASALSEAQGLVSLKRHEALTKAFPPAPEGWKFKPSDPQEGAAMVFAMTGFVVNGNYQGPANERVSVEAMVDSPMVQMMSMMITNPAMIGEDAELIKYGKHSGVLEKNGDKRFVLTVLIDNDIVKAEGSGVSDEALLSLISQAAIDRFEAAMAQ